MWILFLLGLLRFLLAIQKRRKEAMAHVAGEEMVSDDWLRDVALEVALLGYEATVYDRFLFVLSLFFLLAEKSKVL
jgi:hypothetical protein